MNVVFVAPRHFDDAGALSRAMAVTIEDYLIDAGLTHLTLESLENAKLRSMLIQYEDMTKRFLSQQGLSVSTSITLRDPEDFPDFLETARVVVFGKITYFPHKAFVKEARDQGIDVMEF